MTKKDHEALVEVLRVLRHDLSTNDHYLVTTQLAAMLRRDNGKFDLQKFVLACTTDPVRACTTNEEKAA